MKLLLRLLLLAMMGCAYAQNNLPACQGSDSSRWTNCSGTRSWPNGEVYVGAWKDGWYHGQGTLTLSNGN